jgi:hypothetical protein
VKFPDFNPQNLKGINQWTLTSVSKAMPKIAFMVV